MSSAILDIMDPPTLSIAIFHQSENQRNEDTGRESESLQVKQAQREWEEEFHYLNLGKYARKALVLRAQ